MSSFYDDVTSYFNNLFDESADKDKKMFAEIERRKKSASKTESTSQHSTVKTILIGAAGAVLGAYLIKELKLFKLL